MERRIVLGLCAMGMLGLSLPAEVAIAQQKNLAAQLVGTWSLVSNINVKKDGTTGAGYAELTWKRVT